MTSVYFGGGVASKIAHRAFCAAANLAFPSSLTLAGPARRAAAMALLYAPAIGPAFGSNQAFRDGCVYSDPMDTMPEGLTDKVYWRKARGEWHCFKKLPEVRGYISLCQGREISFVQGQQIARPETHLRCSLCDGLEMARRGWEGPGPVSPRRAERFSR
jgi:hypothetical protein